MGRGGRIYGRWRRTTLSFVAALIAVLATPSTQHADISPPQLFDWAARPPLALEVETAYGPFPTGTTTQLQIEDEYPAEEREEAHAAGRRQHESTTLEIEEEYPVPQTAEQPHLKVAEHHLMLEAEEEYPGLALEEHYPAGTVLDIEEQYPSEHVMQLGVETDYASTLTISAASLGLAQTPAVAAPSVALTFDAEIPHGEEARRTLNQVLDTLHAADVRATFFVVGWWAEANPEVLRRMVADGHEVANHSMTHQVFMNRPPAQLHAELRQVANIVLRETGSPIAPLFRPPYGCIDDATTRLVRHDGYQLAGWTASGTDARGRTQSATEVVAAVRRDLGDGKVVLLHTNRWITAAALPDILHLIAARGLEAVTVSELLRQHPLDGTRLAWGALRDCTVRSARAGHVVRIAN